MPEVSDSANSGAERPFVLRPREKGVPSTSGNSFLARLRATKQPAFEFALRLEPIVQITARFLTAFEIDLVCAKSDLLLALRASH